MALPSRDVIVEIKALIQEITGFKEDEENFVACQQYCLSHVVHHSYPSVNKTSVKNLLDGFASRFYGHGRFKVAEALNSQVKSFLNNNDLFKQNPEFDIEWMLLSLLSNLSSNLTSVAEVPELLPTDDEQEPVDNVNWAEYLNQDYLADISEKDNEDDEIYFSDVSEDQEIQTDPSNASTTLPKTFKSICVLDETEKDDAKYSSRKDVIEDFIQRKGIKTSVESDCALRGHLTENFDAFLESKGVCVRSDILTEAEAVEIILYQFQTGEDTFRRKGVLRPALCSISHESFYHFLSPLQPYLDIIKTFKDFNQKVMDLRYKVTNQCSSEQNQVVVKRDASEILQSTEPLPTLEDKDTTLPPQVAVECEKRTISNVLKAYSASLQTALDPFEHKIMEMEINRSSYTLMSLERELRPYFVDIQALYRAHCSATRNWQEEPNWKCAVRIISVLYYAMIETTSRRISFLFLDMFLNCFQIYLDIIDSWIACVTLTDIHKEFIITRVNWTKDLENSCGEFTAHPYLEALMHTRIPRVDIIEVITEKMTEAGQSLEVLSKLDRFITPSTWDDDISRNTLYQLLVNEIEADVLQLLGVTPLCANLKQHAKDKSIFTLKNIPERVRTDDGCGEQSGGEHGGGEPKQDLIIKSCDANKKENICRDSESETKWAFSRNVFFEMAFKEVQESIQKIHTPSASRTTLSLSENNFCKLNSELKSSNEASLKGSVLPLQKIIKQHFSSMLNERLTIACTQVKDIILKEFGLMKHLALLRSVLLFNDAYLLQPFIAVFFSQPGTWQNSYSLTLHLKECVEVAYKDLSAGLAVVTKEGEPPSNVLDAIDNIAITYEVQWPLTLILHDDVIARYNDVFRLVLKLKWAHSTLCCLRFQKTDKNTPSIVRSTYHRLQLLRCWCLSDLNRIANYFTAQLSMPLDVEPDSCRHLKNIISTVENFIRKIHSRCLLSGDRTQDRDLIFASLIPLCKDLENFWLRGSIVAAVKLKLMEDLLKSCHKQLCRLMTTLEKEETVSNQIGLNCAN